MLIDRASEYCVHIQGTASAGPRAGSADRRRYPRRAIPGIEGTLRSPGDVRILELSLTGLSAEVSSEIQPGEHCFLELRHHHDTKHDSAMVEAIVKWTAVRGVEREANRLVPRFCAGMAFVDIDRDGTGGIWDCILTEAEA